MQSRQSGGYVALKSIRLKGLSFEISQLGFGCAGLTAVGDRRECARILEHAYDCGVRHFDVARLYGAGIAEGILGEFLRGRRNEVTVTTKFGLNPPAIPSGIAPYVQTIKRMLRRVPMLDRVVRRQVAQWSTSGRFDPDAARQSLETSLRELKTDYLDLWLLHEATATDANDPALLAFLAEQKSRGTIRAHGIASDFTCIEGAHFSSAHTVFQFENSVVSPNRARLADAGERTIITHGALKHFSSLRALLRQCPGRMDHFQRETNVDLAQADQLSALLLAWSVHDNPNGVVLFNSSRLENIRANVAALEDSRFNPETTARFAQLVAGFQSA